MGKSKEITPRKRAIVIQYSKDGLKRRDICKKLSVSESAVSRTIKKFKTTGSSSPQKHSGRPSVCSKRDDSAIRRCGVKNAMYSSVQIQMETGVKASTCTIRRRLFSNWFNQRRPSRTPLLTKEHRKKKVDFCK